MLRDHLNEHSEASIWTVRLLEKKHMYFIRIAPIWQQQY